MDRVFMGADSIGWYTFLYGSDQMGLRPEQLDGLAAGRSPRQRQSPRNETAIDIAQTEPGIREDRKCRRD